MSLAFSLDCWTFLFNSCLQSLYCISRFISQHIYSVVFLLMDFIVMQKHFVYPRRQHADMHCKYLYAVFTLFMFKKCAPPLYRTDRTNTVTQQ